MQLIQHAAQSILSYMRIVICKVLAQVLEVTKHPSMQYLVNNTQGSNQLSAGPELTQALPG